MVELRINCPLYGTDCNIRNIRSTRDCGGEYIQNTRTDIFYFRVKSGQPSDIYHCDKTREANGDKVTTSKLKTDYWKE